MKNFIVRGVIFLSLPLVFLEIFFRINPYIENRFRERINPYWNIDDRLL